MAKVLNHYSHEFKLQVIKEVLSGKTSKEAARKKYGIKSKSGILNWMRKFGLSEYKSIPDYFERMKKDETTDNEALKQRIRELERALEDAQMKSAIYSKMIEVAERDLKISIRKKPSTKQSGK